MFEKIESYLNGELAGEELQQFEAQLAADPALREQLLLYQNIESEMKQQHIGKEGETQLRQTLTELNSQYFTSSGTSAEVISIKSRKRYIWPAAAAAILIVCMVGYWLVFRQGDTDKKLYARYAVHQPISQQRGAGDSSRLLQEAIVFYNQKEYINALPGLLQYTDKDRSDGELILAAGICELETERYPEALNTFDYLAANHPVFVNQAIWYKALVYLKKKDIPACKKLLQSIPANADTYKKAQELFQKL